MEGRWLLGIKDVFDWSRKTADRFIDVGRASFKVANLASLDVPVSGLYLLAAPSTPAEVIEVIAERSADGERLSLDAGEAERLIGVFPALGRRLKAPHPNPWRQGFEPPR